MGHCAGSDSARIRVNRSKKHNSNHSKFAWGWRGKMKFSIAKVSIVLLVVLVTLVSRVRAAGKEAFTLDDSEEAHAVQGDEVSSEDADDSAVDTIQTSERMNLEAFDRQTDEEATEMTAFENQTTDRGLFCPRGFPFLCPSNGKCCARSKCCRNQCCPRRFDKFCTVNGFCLNKHGLALCKTTSGKYVAGALCKNGSCCLPGSIYSQCSLIKGRTICSTKTGIINCSGRPGLLCSKNKCCKLPTKCCGNGRCC